MKAAIVVSIPLPTRPLTLLPYYWMDPVHLLRKFDAPYDCIPIHFCTYSHYLLSKKDQLPH